MNNSIHTKGRLKIHFEFENNITSLSTSKEVMAFLLDNIKHVTSHSFRPQTAKAVVLFLGRKSFQFISVKGRCFVIKKAMTIYDLLTAFMKPELARGLIDKVENVIGLLKNANTFTETAPFNNPFQLFLEPAS